MVRALLCLSCLIVGSFAYAQKSLFVAYSVEQGLGQSQATGLAQDRFHNLWISHLGGISRFDGRHFKTYTTADGLQSNFCNSVLVDQTGNVWIGTHTGLSTYDGATFKNFELFKTGRPVVVTSIQCDRNNRVWALGEGELYEATTTICKKAGIPVTSKRVLAVGLDANRDPLIVVEGGSILRLHDNMWKSVHTLDFVDQQDLRVRRIYTGPSGSLYFVSNKGVFVYREKKWRPLRFGDDGPVQGINILEDDQQRTWVTTTKGVYRFSDSVVTHLDTRQGFTDHAVYSMLRDTEGNFWFSTIGSGIIRYTDSRSLYFDKEILKNVGVSGITKTSDGNLWFGTYGGGVRRFDGNSLKEYNIPQKLPATGIINFCMADKKDGLWIGTQGGGLWYLKNGVYNEVTPNPLVDNRAFYSGHQDHRGRVIFSTHQGVYEYANGLLRLVGNEKIFANTAAFIGDDSILAGTPQGTYLLHQNQKKKFHSNNLLSRATVLSIVRHHDQILIGTADKGLFIVSLKNGAIAKVDMQQGLSSNCIYAIAVDSSDRIWLSTGHYVNHFRLGENGIINELTIAGKSDGILSPEGNTNSLFVEDTVVWVGNLNGLNRIALNDPKPAMKPLEVLVTDVRLFSAQLEAGSFNSSIRKYYPVPNGLRLPHNKNHLTFNFHAVSLTNPDEIYYQYRIREIDQDFSPPTSNNEVVYSSLPPGRHTLQVKAVTLIGIQSQVTEYSFVITPPFYQLWYVQVLFVLIALCLAAFLFHLRSVSKERRRKEKEKAKKEEQQLVRTRTAQDFHDDIGNKLTRINVLTEVLKNKAQVNEETKGLIEQIQENTIGLYSSSRDLIWSLSNDEGTFDDLRDRLIHFGKSLFQNTGIIFEYSDIKGTQDNYAVDPEISRNVTLLVKEAMNNALKHAEATNVHLNTELGTDQATITINDNGKGYIQDEVTNKGYGLENMRTRAERIGASIKQTSSLGTGTCIVLQFSLSYNHQI